jgi:hypothetical protein
VSFATFSLQMCDEDHLRARPYKKRRPIGHFAGYNMPAAPVFIGVAGISTFWKAKFTFESAQ